MRIGEDTITILRAPIAADTFGNDRRDWTAASETTVVGCSVQPVTGAAGLHTTAENTLGRDTVITLWQLFAPVDTDLEATDRVEFAGDTYDVDGDIGRWNKPPLSHATAVLRKTANV